MPPASRCRLTNLGILPPTHHYLTNLPSPLPLPINDSALYARRLSIGRLKRLMDYTSPITHSSIQVRCHRLRFMACLRQLIDHLHHHPCRHRETSQHLRYTTLHADVHDPHVPSILCGCRYYTLFTAALSIFTHVHFSVGQNEGRQGIRNCMLYLELRTDTNTHIVSSTLLTATDFENFFTSRGIALKLSAPYSHFQNGVAEKIGARDLLEHAAAMMQHAGLGEAVEHLSRATALTLIFLDSVALTLILSNSISLIPSTMHAVLPVEFQPCTPIILFIPFIIVTSVLMVVKI